MAIAVSVPAQEQKKDAFKESSKINGDEWLILTFLATFVGVFSSTTFFSNYWIGTLICIVFSVVLSISISSLFWAFVGVRRNYACSQCFQVAEEIGLVLTQEQVVKLQKISNGGWVFKYFVAWLPAERLAQPKEHYFAVGDLDNSEQCRQFVRFLHDNPGVFLPEPVHSATDESEQPEKGLEA